MSNDYELIDIDFDFINNGVYSKLEYLNERPNDPMERLHEYSKAISSGRSFINPSFKGIKKMNKRIKTDIKHISIQLKEHNPYYREHLEIDDIMLACIVGYYYLNNLDLVEIDTTDIFLQDEDFNHSGAINIEKTIELYNTILSGNSNMRITRSSGKIEDFFDYVREKFHPETFNSRRRRGGKTKVKRKVTKRKLNKRKTKKYKK